LLCYVIFFVIMKQSILKTMI